MKEIIEQIEALIKTDFDGSNSYDNYCLGVNDTIGNVIAILESHQGKEESQFKTFVDNFLSVLPEEEREKLKMYDTLPAIDLSKRGKESVMINSIHCECPECGKKYDIEPPWRDGDTKRF